MIQAIFRLNWPSGFEGDFESLQVYEVLNWPSGLEEDFESWQAYERTTDVK
jgi:hypothetical protein